MIGKNKTASILMDIYNEIVIDDNYSKHYPMRFGLEICVTESGVEIRNRLASLLYEDINVSYCWSERSTLDVIGNFIRDLGVLKKEDSYPDFDLIASQLIDKFSEEYDECEALTVVEGLLTSQSIRIGNVTFFPFDHKQSLLKRPPFDSLFEDVYPTRDCIATAKYKTESRRSIEHLYIDTEYCLNIFRYIGTLVWADQIIPRISIHGRPRSNNSYSLSIDGEGQVSAIVLEEFGSMPYRLNEETSPYANFHGLDYLQSLVDKTDKTQIEHALLVSIQWFGDATQEVQPLSSFIKYYMPLDILLKRDEERAKDVVPNRLCRLLDPWNIKRNGQHKGNPICTI